MERLKEDDFLVVDENYDAISDEEDN